MFQRHVTQLFLNVSGAGEIIWNIPPFFFFSLCSIFSSAYSKLLVHLNKYGGIRI